MNTLLRSFLTVVLVGTFAFGTRAQNSTTAPSASYLSGRRQAEEDVKRGVYVIRRLGLDPPSVGTWPSKTELYRSILTDRYQIRSENWYGCIIGEVEIDEVKGYNEVSQKAIENRFGEGFLANVEREANAEWELKYGQQHQEFYQRLERISIPTDRSAETVRTLYAIAPTRAASPPQDELKPPTKRKFDYPAKIQTTYDQAENQSMVFFPLLRIKALETPVETYEPQISDERLAFSAYFVYPGKQFATPHWVNLAFLSHTENPQKYTDHLLRIKADDQWLELGTMKVLSTTNYSRRGQLPLTAQTMELPISYEQFLRLANAKKLKVKLGSVEFSFEKAQLEAIRDLAAHTVP